MSGRFGSVARPLAAVALVAAATAAVGLRPTGVSAAPPDFTKVPTRLYMIPQEHSTVVPDALAGIVLPIATMTFADVPTGDIISGDSREIQFSSAETASCRHHGTDGTGATGDPSDDFDLTGCTAVQLDVGHGTLKFNPAPVAEDDPRQVDPQFKIYRFASGALLRDADTPDDLEGAALALIGTTAEINDTMKTLVYTPTVDDPSTQNIDEDYYYTGSNPETLTVDLVPGDTTEGGTVTKYVDIRVLDYNNFPSVTVPQDQWATDNTGTDLELFTPDPNNSSNPPQTPSLSVADEDNDEVTDPKQDGSDPDNLPGDGDDPDDGAGDEFLVIAWATCGKFSLISSNGFAIQDDLAHAFDYVYDLVKDPVASDPADKALLEDALFALLPDDVEQLPFANVDPTSPTTALVAVADNIASLNYNLGRITFHPVDAGNNPLSDTTCKVRVLVTDIGNNGLPIQYLGDPPAGLEIPMFGVDFDTNYVPAVEEFTITVGGGGAVMPSITSVSNVTLAEGDAGTTPFTFTLTLDEPATGTETVDVSTSYSGGANLADAADLTAITNQTVTFAAGASSATFTVPVDGDTTTEPDENFELTLGNPVGLTIGDPSGLGTIQNDDPSPGVQIDSFTDVTMAEGDSGTTAFTFTIGLSDPAPAGGATVRVTTNHVSTDGTDLTPLLGQQVTFLEGQSSRTVTVNVKGDTTVEPTETFTATLSNPVGVSIAASAQSATGTITNDDYRTVSINDVSQAEGNAGTTAFTFTLSLDGPAVGGEQVLVSTSGGSAVAGVDYTALNLVPVTFAVGDTTATVTVDVNGDTTYEGNDTFLAVLSSPTNLVLGDDIGQGTIVNDDAPLVTVNDVTMAEGNSGDTSFTFTLSLDGPAPAGASVDVATATGTADGTDFTAVATTTVPFVTGSQSASFTVLVSGDTDPESDEDFTLSLSNPQGLQVGADTSGTGTIQNDDGAVTSEMVSIDDVSQAEGNAGTTTFTFTLSLDSLAEGDETVVATVTHGSTDAADLTPTSTMVSFANGATTAQFTVDVNGDTTPEPDDTFTVGLSAPVGLLVTDNLGTGTIVNDDAAHITSIGNVTLAEGDAGTTNFVFTLTLDAPAVGNESVTATSAHVETNDTDFLDGVVPVAFVAGQSTATATVAVNGDVTPENDEDFTLTLSNPQNVIIDPPGAATGTIQNDDGPQAPAQIVSVSDVAMNEGDAGDTAFTFTLSLDQPAVGNESVVASTAHVGTDNVDLTPLTAQPVTFAAAATTATVTVLVHGDPDVESDETFTVLLASPQNVTIGDSMATGTIQNDDVVVQPPSPLTITVPADITVPNDPGQPGAIVNYPAPTTNGGVAPVTINCSSPSGGFYPIGVTTVTCTATDSAPDQGQTALAVVTDSFTITVVDTTPPSTTTTPVTPPPPPPTSGVTAPDVDELPATGGDTRTPLLVAGLTCLAGVALLLVRRRTRSAT